MSSQIILCSGSAACSPPHYSHTRDDKEASRPFSKVGFHRSRMSVRCSEGFLTPFLHMQVLMYMHNDSVLGCVKSHSKPPTFPLHSPWPVAEG